MATRRKSTTSDGGAGAPEWMLTYSDCMTLLLTFFVLLISFSSFDEKVYKRLESTFTEGLASIGVRPSKDQEALQPVPRIVHREELNKGSEQPTVNGKYEANPSQSLDFLDFQNQKVFLLPSEKVFWGRGYRLSAQGRQLLADIAELLQAVPNRVLVAEHALGPEPETRDPGLRRAWCVMEFLGGQPGLQKTRFSISAAGTVDDEIIRRSTPFAGRASPGRALEIVILERSLYR